MPDSHVHLANSSGLYDPSVEHDSCGVGFVAHLRAARSHAVVRRALALLANLEHRGSYGLERTSGDGAGVLIQVPDAFLRTVVGFELPIAGWYGVGLVFLPHDRAERDTIKAVMAGICREEGQVLLGWRTVPTDDSLLGEIPLRTQPVFEHVIIGAGASTVAAEPRRHLNRRLYVIRKRVEHAVDAMPLSPAARASFYVCSLSADTLVYKGMLTAQQLPAMFPDLTDPALTSALALVHERFSTSTFPSWPLAHPHRIVAHNGEITTLRGNINWMTAREGLLQSDWFEGGLARILPIIRRGGSDTSTFDNVLEFLVMSGRSLPHALCMMIPEAWQNDEWIDPARRAFYEYHAALMEPWDGPATMAFSDGTTIGALLDRNGLRPARYCVTNDDFVIMASEVGALDIPPGDVLLNGALHPGRFLLVDTATQRIIHDDEVKSQLAAERPYPLWVAEHLIDIEDLPPAAHLPPPDHATVLHRQQVFGYTDEVLRLLLVPMAEGGEEAIGSMGSDTVLTALSRRPRLLFDFFTQQFAQVTNPPLDVIRELQVASLASTIGPEGNLLDPKPWSCRQIAIKNPVISNEELARIRGVGADPGGYTPEDAARPDLGFRAITLHMLFEPKDSTGLERAMATLCRDASAAVAEGRNVVILSDRGNDWDRAPIPSLLATAGVHNHLVREGVRTRCALVVEGGDAREVHHCALLIGYGAGAVNPYVAFETLDDMIRQGRLPSVTHEGAVRHYIKALNRGILTVMSKAGISTLQSYRGAQLFEAIGLDREFVDHYFTGTASRLGGVGIKAIAEAVAARHAHAYDAWPPSESLLDGGGQYQWRRHGDYHLFNPETVFKLQHATRAGQYGLFKEYTTAVDDQQRRYAALRGLLRLKPAGSPVPVDEVEAAPAILRRFTTSAMSYGSISQEAHETLAIAMNRLGGRSNAGEGGETSERSVPLPSGDSRRSVVRQVASGRFGVTSEYLVNADELQIKMAQGASPGEGGLLPRDKVTPSIAGVRHATPHVALHSPAAHHDIYSFEDLAQTIFDLKNANPAARISVKLVAQAGIGTVAAGLAKAKADAVLISGHDGGTGAALLTGIKHCGLPWELGIAEAQQALVHNGLRDRVVLQADGQLKTGRDVVVAALLGAEEYGFATAPLVVMGCVMVRVCHLNTCPVGIATQDPELRRRFTGTPELVENFFTFLAQEVRETMASLGFRTIDEMIGRVDCLDVEAPPDGTHAATLDLSALLYQPAAAADVPRRCVRPQDHGLESALDNELIGMAEPALRSRTPVELRLPVRNVNSAVGTMLGSEVTRRFGKVGLPDDTIRIHHTGSAGQSFGAFLPPGITISLEGDANDGFGKGLSGGRLCVRPSDRSTFVAEENIIIGNSAFYGATSGEAFVRGTAGQRCCVRNSGAIVVVEGIGDHGCESMTAGLVIVLGRTGLNFAAGMTGGVAYVLDVDEAFFRRCNLETVDLEPLADANDLELVAELLIKHRKYTGSLLAARLLTNWTENGLRFVRVMPRDYRRQLLAQATRPSEATAPGGVASEIAEAVTQDPATMRRPHRATKAERVKAEARGYGVRSGAGQIRD